MKQWKRWTVAVALLFAGGAGGFLLSGERTAGKTASLVDAWHEAFGGTVETIVEVPLDVVQDSDDNIQTPEPVPEVKKPAVKKAKKPVVKVAAKPKASVPQTFAPMVNGTSTANAPYLAAGSCDVSRAEAPRGGVVMNEVAWMGSGGNEMAQWMEFKNMSRRKAVDLKDWKVLDRDGSPVVAFEEKTSLAPGKVTVVAREVTAEEEDPFFKEEAEERGSVNVFSGMLSRHGGWLKLFDADCVLVDELSAPDGWPGGDRLGATLERKANRGWQTSAAPGGTPRKENSAGFTPSRPVLAEDTSGGSAPVTNDPPDEEEIPPEDTLPANMPVIAALHTTGGPGMTDHDAVKIYNPNDEAYAIGGWKLRKKTKTGTESSVKTFAEGSVIPARGYFVWTNTKFIGVTADATSTATLSDDNSVALLNKEDEVVDAVAWGNGHANPFVEGAPYPENPRVGEWLGRKAEGNNLVDLGNNAEDFEM